MSLTDPTRSTAAGNTNSDYTDGTARAWRGRDGRYHHTAGENSRGAKLTETQARDIKGRPRTEKHADIAAEYGISRGAVAAIRQGKAWTHLDKEEAS